MNRPSCRVSAVRALRALGAVLLLLGASPADATFVTFESGQVRPLALSPTAPGCSPSTRPTTGSRSSTSTRAGSTHAGSVPVGLEPVAVAARTDGEVWVVNHLSDSVSIVDVGRDAAARRRARCSSATSRATSSSPGPGGNRAFITTAHRGQNCPVPIAAAHHRRASAARDVWVFDATNLGAALGGTPLAIVDAVRRHAARARRSARRQHRLRRRLPLRQPDDDRSPRALVCDGGAGGGPCTRRRHAMPGGLPAPERQLPTACRSPRRA